MMVKNILITGASKGIGKALTEKYLMQGHRVFGVSRTKPDINSGNYFHFCADVADEDKATEIFFKIRKQSGGLDVLINNAGIAKMNAFSLTPLQNVHDIINTNFIGTFLYSQKAIKLLRKSAHPRIINLSTVAVPLNLAGEAAYAASKSAVETLTKIIAKEAGGFGITCNAVGPSPIETQLISGVGKDKIDKLIASQAIQKMASIDDVINVVDFYMLPASDMISGQIVYLGGVS